MATTTVEHTVFLASPKDTEADGDQLATVIEEINQTFAPDGHRLRALRWKADARPDAGRPQGLINEQIPDYDIFVAVLWTRLGTPTGGFGSGTEEEITRAITRRATRSDMPVFIYFCERPFWPRSLDDIDQLRRVFEFRERLAREEKAFPWDYGDEVKFRDLVRSHLCKRLREIAKPTRPGRSARIDPAAVANLHTLWPKLDPQAQQAFSMAYNQTRAAGDPGVATEHLFSALVRVAHESDDTRLRSLFEQIPAAALPGPIDGFVPTKAYIAMERPWLSHCVASSVARLGRSLPPGRTLTGADIFADIAKHGTGSSVARLRQHRIQPEDIDSYVRRAGLDVVDASA